MADAFAAALRDDLREPGEDAERQALNDPEQLEYECDLDAWTRQAADALDGDGVRALNVPTGRVRDWFGDYMRGAMLDGLTGRLHGGTTAERRATVQALGGWVDVMHQLGDDTDAPSVSVPQSRVGPIVRTLKGDRDGWERSRLGRYAHHAECRAVAPVFVATIDRLIARLEAGEPIVLTEPQAEATTYGSAAAGPYLLGLIRDRFEHFTDWREFVALGILAADIQAASIGGLAGRGAD